MREQFNTNLYYLPYYREGLTWKIPGTIYQADTIDGINSMLSFFTVHMN